MPGGEGRLAGVGFLVGAKDDGATEVFDDTAESADRMADAAEQAGSRGASGIDRLGRAIEGINAVNLANISSTLDGIAERAGLGVGAQSTALESFGAQFAQTARAAEARLGSMSGALRAHRGEVSSLAYAYNVSGDEMFAAMAPLSRLGVDINEVFGENATRALAGHLQAGIIGGQAFGQVLSELVGVYDMQAAEAGTLVNSLTAIGDQFGFVAEIGQGLPAIMDAIRPVAARYPTIAEDVDGVATSIARLAAGMVNMGMAPDQALQAATQTFTSLSEQRDAFTDLVTGVSSEFPEMAQQIGISSGDIEGSIAAVMSSPVEFAQRMGELMGSLDDADPFAQRLARTLREINPELLNVVRNTAEGGDAMARATAPIEGVEDAFSRVGRSALTSTLTFSEQLDRMRDAFTTRMNAIGRATDRGFVRRQRDAYKRVGDRIAEYASDQGPLGMLTRGYLRVRTFGLVQGLLPQLGALTEGLGDTVEAAGPMIRAMGDTGLTGAFAKAFQSGGRLAGVSRVLGASFGFLGPITLIAGAGYLLYRNWERLTSLFDDVADGLEKMASKFYNWAYRIDWRDIGDQIVSGILSLFDSAGESAEDAAPSTGARIGYAMASMVTTAASIVARTAVGMWDRVIEWILDPPDIESQVTRGAQALGASIGGLLGLGMLTPLRTNIMSSLGRLFNNLTGLFPRGAAGAARGGLRTLLRRIPYIGAVLGVLFDLPDIIAAFRTEGIVAGLRETFGSILDGLLMGLPSLIGRLTGTEDVVERIFDFLFEGLNVGNIMEAIEGGEIGRAILEGLLAVSGGGFARMLWESLLGEGSMDAVMTGMGGVLEGVGQVFTEIGSAYSTIVEPVWNAMTEAGGQIMDVFRQLWDDTLAPLFSDIAGAFGGLFGEGADTAGIAGGFDRAEASVRGFAEVAGDFIRNYVAPAIIWLAENIMPMVVRGVELFADGVRVVVGFFRAAWPVVISSLETVRDWFDVIAEKVTWWWDTVTRPMLEMAWSFWSTTFDGISTVVEGAFDIIAGVVSWWWENVTRPILGFLWDTWSSNLGRIVDIGRWVFRTIAGVISWWWENVTRPIFGFLWDTWSTVIENIASAARSVFDWMSEFITNRIEDAAVVFAMLGDNWEQTKLVLQTGFRVVAAEINKWLVVPFVRLEGVLVGMAEGVQLAFLRVKEGVLQLWVSILEGFQSMVRRIPRIGERLASAMDPAVTRIRERAEAIGGRGGERARLESQIEQRRREREARIQAARDQAAEARAAHDQAVMEGQRAAGRVRASRQSEARREREARVRQEQAAEAGDERRRRQARERRLAAEGRRRSSSAAALEEREQAAQTAADAREERRAARQQTESRRERERQERERQERRGRGARRAQGRQESTRSIAEAMAEAMGSGPGSSRDNPTHVVVEGVADRALGRAPTPAPGQPVFGDL